MCHFITLLQKPMLCSKQTANCYFNAQLELREAHLCIVRKEVYLPFAWKEMIFSFSFSNTYPTELSHFYLFSYLTDTVYYCSSKNYSVAPAGRVFFFL